jgi:hypothetical protein
MVNFGGTIIAITSNPFLTRFPLNPDRGHAKHRTDAKPSINGPPDLAFLLQLGPTDESPTVLEQSENASYSTCLWLTLSLV